MLVRLQQRALFNFHKDNDGDIECVCKTNNYFPITMLRIKSLLNENDIKEIKYYIMQSKDNIINLEDFRVKEGNRISKVFTGRDRGEYIRKHSNIDKIEEKYSEITVIIPKNIYSINPSFLEEFLFHVVVKLGKENFLKKFHFISEGDYDFEIPLNQAIDRILKKQTTHNKL